MSVAASRTEFYQSHLNRVSRSFAFCIEQLDAPMRDWVSLSYLLCRILDTVEDSAWPTEEMQNRQFAELRRFIEAVPAPEGVRQWIKNFDDVAIPEGERDLIRHADLILTDLHGEGFAQVRGILQSLSLTMSEGMEQFARSKRRGELRLKNLAEINKYCFYVAGLVGEALAKLLAKVEEAFSADSQRISEAHHFGLFLQKVNLLKDQSVDETQGRFLVGDRRDLWQSMVPDLQGAFRFLTAIPLQQKKFRTFCAWSLFLGLGTLAMIKDPVASPENLKLNRKEAERILLSVSAFIDDPSQLEELFLAMGERAGLDVREWNQRSLSFQLNS